MQTSPSHREWAKKVASKTPFDASTLVGAVVSLSLLLSPGCAKSGSLGQAPESPAAPAGLEVFDESRVHSVELSLSDSDWQTLITEAATSEGYGSPHPYVRSRVAFDGDSLDEDVGLRLKGHLSLQLADGRSFPFKLDFNRFEKGVTLDGLKKLNLHADFNGPTLPIMREYVSYGAWREFGVPASRTSFARVSVNNGDLGVYVLVEQVDGGFIKRHFSDPYGDLYKPEQVSGTLEYRGPNISDYPDINHKWPAQTDHAALLNALRTLDSGTQSSLSQVFGVRGVLTYLAGNVALGSGDFYPHTGHNYYLYEESPGQFTMLPWDMNGSQEAHDTRVCSAAEGYLSGRLLEDPNNEALYREILSDFLDSSASSTWLIQRLDAAESLLGSAVSAREIADMRRDIQERHARLQGELTSTARCTGEPH
ncbi:CotH kinase family protein [Planctomycetota bacterium]